MSHTPAPRLILETLFPYLKTAAAYAQQIQSKIAARPVKEDSDNFFAAALSDADLSIQTLIEVALLGHFPNVRFYGEEYEQAYNTKYFRAIDLGSEGDYLVTLDPIDGTQYYLDGHRNYQIILGILDHDEFEAAIAISPAQNTYYYAVRGEGTWQGKLDADWADCHPLRIEQKNSVILLGWGMGAIAPPLKEHYRVLDVATDYSLDIQIPNVNGILAGELAGVVLQSAKWIDGAALAFLAQEAGCIVTTLEGQPLPPLHTDRDRQRPGLVVAVTPEIHQHLLEASQFNL